MNKKNGKRKSLIILVLLLLVGLTSAYVASTYAKYTEELTGKKGEAVIAKWAFAEDNASSEFEFDLTETAIPATKLAADRIAPGTAGTFTIELVNSSTETGIDVSIVLGEITNANNIVFTSDGQQLPNNRTFTRHLDAAGSNGTTEQTVVINWYWPYYENDNQDAADTTIGKGSNGQNSKLELPLTIVGTQTEPTPEQGQGG